MQTAGQALRLQYLAAIKAPQTYILRTHTLYTLDRSENIMLFCHKIINKTHPPVFIHTQLQYLATEYSISLHQLKGSLSLALSQYMMIINNNVIPCLLEPKAFI